MDTTEKSDSIEKANELVKRALSCQCGAEPRFVQRWDTEQRWYRVACSQYLKDKTPFRDKTCWSGPWRDNPEEALYNWNTVMKALKVLYDGGVPLTHMTHCMPDTILYDLRTSPELGIDYLINGPGVDELTSITIPDENPKGEVGKK